MEESLAPERNKKLVEKKERPPTFSVDAELKRSIFHEHISEAGSLLAFYVDDMMDTNLSWQNAIDEERRLIAHIDGLELGQDLARHCAVECLTSDDEDLLLGAAYALATININDNGLDVALEAFVDEEDEERLGHFITAFKHGQHPLLGEKLKTLLDHDRPMIRAATVEILGYRREGEPRRIWPLLHDKDPMVQGAVILALARFGYHEALPAAEQLLLQSGEAVNEDHLLVLLMLGSKTALDLCRRACISADTVTPRLLVYLSMAGSLRDFNIVLSAKQYRHAAEGVIQALGLFGQVAAVPHLIAALKLDMDDLRAEAGMALEMITGAGLRETIQVPEEEPEDLKVRDILGENLEGEAEEQDEAENPRMVEIERPCTSHAIWKEWWQNNAERFDPGKRWRKGQPFDLGACIAEMACPDSHYHDRGRAYLELVIRSGQHTGFEPDWFIPRQLSAIKEWQSWWATHRETLAHNPWLFAGQ